MDEDGICSGTNARIALYLLLLNHRQRMNGDRNTAVAMTAATRTTPKKNQRRQLTTTCCLSSPADLEFSTAPAFIRLLSTLFVSYRPSRSFVLVLHGSLRGKEPPRRGFLEGLEEQRSSASVFALYKVVGAQLVGCIVLYFSRWQEQLVFTPLFGWEGMLISQAAVFYISNYY